MCIMEDEVSDCVVEDLLRLPLSYRNFACKKKITEIGGPTPFLTKKCNNQRIHYAVF
jgi:hypothetical protein